METMQKEDLHYPDLKHDGLGDLKSIKRLPQMQKDPPKIKWGKEYLSWPDKRKLFYAERLACSMNHAADILQKERDKIIKISIHLEKQVEQLKQSYDQQVDLMHKKMVDFNAEKQKLFREIKTAKRELKLKNIRIKQLEDK